MKAITGIDYAQFVLEHPTLSYDDLPPWGGVIKWGERAVLVYFAPETHKLFLTDVSDNPTVIDSTATFDPATLHWWYYFPQEFMNNLSKLPNPVAPSTTVPIAIIAIVLLVLLKGK